VEKRNIFVPARIRNLEPPAHGPITTYASRIPMFSSKSIYSTFMTLGTTVYTNITSDVTRTYKKFTVVKKNKQTVKRECRYFGSGGASMNYETLLSCDVNIRTLGLRPFPMDKYLLFCTKGMHSVVTCGKNATNLQSLTIGVTIRST
jgi:hypothetical protein